MKNPCLSSLVVCVSILFTSSSIGLQAAETAPSGTNKQLESNMTSFVYFTGIGCPHCANVDPVLLKSRVRRGDLLVVEYEIYRDSVNAPLLMAYDSKYGTGLGVPMVVVEARTGGAVVGDTPILKMLDGLIAQYKGNGVVLYDKAYAITDLPLTDLPRLPKLWFKDRVAVRKDPTSRESDSIKAFLLNGVEPQGCIPTSENGVALSSDNVSFAKACSFGGWVLLRD